MKSVLNIIFIYFFSTLAVFAQEPGKTEITGKIIDVETNKPLEFATVSAYESIDSSRLITGVVTKADGSFQLMLPKGKYDFLVQFVSYVNTRLEDIQVSGKRLNLGRIDIEQNVATLSAVVVEGQKDEMELALDKRIFNVNLDPSNVGRNVSEILDNLPSVTVDQDGNVALRGSGNVRILIDGKPSGLVGISGSDALRQLQGNLVEKVEIVTNPSVRYEAEGMAGIINIVLKKDQRSGINGAFEVTAGYPDNHGLSANINFRRPKLNYFFNYGVNYRKMPGSGNSYQKFNLPDTSFITRRTSERTRGGWSHTARAGADWFLNKRTTITGAFLVRLADQENTSDLIYRDFDIADNPLRSSLRRDVEQEDELNTEFSLNFERTFPQKERKLTGYVQYRLNTETEDSDIEETMLTEEVISNEGNFPLFQQSLNNEHERNFLIQADYIHPLGEKAKAEAGFRSTFRRIDNDFKVEEEENGVWNILPGFTNQFFYDEIIHAAYGLYGNQLKRISYQAGVRVEVSDIRTELLETNQINDRSYTDFFPSAHFTYKLSKVNSLQASYSRRISRPDFWALNPFYTFSDARNIRTGNPDVNPEYTNSYELGNLYNKNKISAYGGIYYRHTTGVIDRVSYVEEDGITYSKPLNLATENSFGAEVNGNYDITDWWKINGNFNFYRAITEGAFEGEDLSRDTYTWNARFNSQFVFLNKTNAQINLFYRAPQETTQGRNEEFYVVNLGLSKDIINGNGTVTFGVRDVLNTRRYRGVTYGEGFYSENEFRWAPRQVTVGFTYRLNQAKKRSSSSSDGGDNIGGDDGF